MISVCRKYIAERLESAGIPAVRIYATPENMESYKVSPWAAVFASPDQQPMERLNRRVGYEMIRKQGPVGELTSYNRYRVMIWSWVVMIYVIITKKQVTTVDSAVEDVAVNFLASLDGFHDAAGNYIDLTTCFAEWPQDKSILKEDQQVVLLLKFSGGIYIDKDVPIFTREQVFIDVR